VSDVARLAAELVRIPSVNPALDPTGAGEADLARFVAAWADDRGLDTSWLGPAERPSVLVRLRGRGGGRTLMLNAHLDTVGVHGMDAPFEPRVRDGRMVGRGAMDMKASLAASLSALHDLQRGEPLRGDVVVAAVADEEHDSIGTRAALAALPQLDLAVVTEPTDLTLHVAHRGFAVVEVELTGRASHTSQPERGVNAVTHLGRLLGAVDEADRRLRATPAHPLLGHGGWQAVGASGGEELFTTPVAARATLERRTLPGEASASAEAEVDAMLAALTADDPRLGVAARTVVAREAFAVAADDPAVAAVAAAAEAVTGRAPERRGAPYWTDAALIAAAGVPTVLYGPVGGGIHQPGEWVDLASVDVLRRVLARLARDVCA
jgi:acetylornithine deacetylase